MRARLAAGHDGRPHSLRGQHFLKKCYTDFGKRGSPSQHTWYLQGTKCQNVNQLSIDHAHYHESGWRRSIERYTHSSVRQTVIPAIAAWRDTDKKPSAQKYDSLKRSGTANCVLNHVFIPLTLFQIANIMIRRMNISSARLFDRADLEQALYS